MLKYIDPYGYAAKSKVDNNSGNPSVQDEIYEENDVG